MIRGLMIDFGGTVDTDGVHWYNMFRKAYSLCGVDLSDELLRDAYVNAERTLGRNRMINPNYTFRKTLEIKTALQKEYLERHGIENIDADSILNFCYESVTDNIRIVSKPALSEITEYLPVVLVTNFYGNMHAVLREFGLDGLIKDVVESSVVGIRKPDPEIFALGLSVLGFEPHETLAVGDSAGNDIIPAQKTGCRTVWLKGIGWEEQECHPDATVSSLSELPALIPKF